MKTTKTAGTVETIDAKINAIRRAAGNPGLRCPTCGGSEHNPYRRIVGEKLVEGCVDSFHGPGLACGGLSSSRDWHMRPEAVFLRKKELEHLKAVSR